MIVRKTRQTSVPCRDCGTLASQCGDKSVVEITSCSCGFKGPVCIKHFDRHFDNHRDCLIDEVSRGRNHEDT